MKQKIFLWLPVLLWCSLIYHLSSIPNLRTEFGFWDLVLRKVAHMVEYGILFLLTRRALRKSGRAPVPAASGIAAVFAVLYAASDEFHQSFVPTRGPSVTDVGIDTAGVLIAAALVTLQMKLTSGKHP